MSLPLIISISGERRLSAATWSVQTWMYRSYDTACATEKCAASSNGALSFLSASLNRNRPMYELDAPIQNVKGDEMARLNCLMVR
jgi:hypothetical protein